MIKNLLSKSIVRYILVGGTGFVVEAVIIILLSSQPFNLNPVIAVAIAFWFGLILTFLLQKIIAFKNTERSAKSISFQTLSYLALVLVNYLFTIFFVWITQDALNIIVARAIALVITTAWNYVIYSKLIFREK